jgi:MFS family permease
MSDDEVVRITPETVSVRRAPKYGRFIILGAGLGVIVTYILTSLFEVDPKVGFVSLFAYFALFGVAGGAVVGAVTALILDRVSSRRAKTVEAEHTTVEEGPIEGELLQ